jgi:hypothetical protein
MHFGWKTGILDPFTIITIVAVATMIPGIILAVMYLDYLKAI